MSAVNSVVDMQSGALLRSQEAQTLAPPLSNGGGGVRLAACSLKSLPPPLPIL